MNTIFQRDFKWHFWARVWQARGLGELSMGLLRRPFLHRVMRRDSPG